ncbi:Ankyrin repeat-containing protein, partial [Globisporangium splendens]
MGNATSWLAQTLCPEEQVLWVAAKSGDYDVLRQALARLTPATRLYLEWRDPLYGYSPLANACAQGHLPCVRLLLEHGADGNARDLRGNTPLHIATKNGKSDVVHALLETARVDVLAKTTTKMQTALDIARQEYKSAESHGHKFIQCIEMIEKKLCIYSGWLYQRADNLLSMASGIAGLNSWKKRYCMILRTAERDVVEIDLFSMKPGERRPPCPSYELVYRASDGVQESEDVTWFSRKEFRFTLNAYAKSGINRVSAPQAFDFAATTQQELVTWKTFFGSLRLGPVNQISQAFGPVGGQGAPYALSSEDALLQEQRDMARAMHLSVEEARRRSSMPAAVPIPTPSAPPLTASFLGTYGSPQATLAPDGVEIVQPLQIGSPPAVAARASTSTASRRIENEEMGKDTGECVICFDGPQSAVCVPCGHNAICMNCAGELMDTTRLCPVCRVQVREVIRIYRS